MFVRFLQSMAPIERALTAVSLAALLFLGGNFWTRSQELAQLPPVFKDAPKASTPGSRAGAVAVSAPILVHVAGEVRKPGVVRLAAGARLHDAIQRAGGATSKGDLGALNLAQKLKDGEQVLVARRGETVVAAAGLTQNFADTSRRLNSPPDQSTLRPNVLARPVNVNTAGAAELETLPGIGPALASRIMAARAERRFASLDDLDAVKGLGPSKLEKLRPYVRF